MPERRVTIRDIAAAAGTMSRALLDLPGVSAELRAKICQTADRPGYRPGPFVAAFLRGSRFPRRGSIGPPWA
jgi:DNA-binding LacI/PurR family transcriptional regulator